MNADHSNLTLQLAEQIFPDYLAAYDRDQLRQLAQTHATPLLLIDGQQVERQYRAITQVLPNVRMHYAIKALPDGNLINTLHQLGCGFDVATAGEIDLLQSCGVTADRCIHTHPIKKDKEIQKALDYGCRVFVVDNIVEIDKFVAYRDQVELMVRINFRNQDAVVDLSRKFGCQLERLPMLMDHAESLGIVINGLSFHVGSQVPSPSAHASAIETSIEIMHSVPDIEWKRLDIGGGFPIGYTGPVMQIEDFCQPIAAALKAVPPGIEVLAEPGRFIAGPSMLGVFSVVGKAHRGARTWYYLDDGVYGTFSGQIYDHAKYPVMPLSMVEVDAQLQPSVLAGPTCDSIDVIDEDIELPELAVGDLMVATQIGAYTLASATEFNLYPKSTVVWCSDLQVKS
ncbi:type III PLP-dependent enzyme [Marinicella sp. W31]|uniref:type III PLP-dependent enzyme n=1 Tax=Marinicella sp. W31 TaxID=3023713 RepID=UPI0037573B23